MSLPSSSSNPFIASWPRQAPSETPVRRSYNRTNNPFTPATIPLPPRFPQPIFDNPDHTPFISNPPAALPHAGDSFSAAYNQTPMRHAAMSLPLLAIPPHHPVHPQLHSAPPMYPPAPFALQQLAPTAAPAYYTEAPNFKVVSISASGWTATEFLDLARRNYPPWSKKVMQTLGMNGGLFLWLNAAHTIPPRTSYPRDHSAWLSNDMAVRSFLQSVSTVPEHGHIAKCTTAAEAWAMLKA
ncbi:hypothetical protein C8J57DRAFT_1526984 [Mycena rebaudengoi]|nr:hypothetical protein C8J57DRAFT_1526984 [Mycena rebaudengoi]